MTSTLSKLRNHLLAIERFVVFLHSTRLLPDFVLATAKKQEQQQQMITNDDDHIFITSSLDFASEGFSGKLLDLIAYCSQLTKSIATHSKIETLKRNSQDSLSEQNTAAELFKYAAELIDSLGKTLQNFPNACENSDNALTPHKKSLNFIQNGMLFLLVIKLPTMRPQNFKLEILPGLGLGLGPKPMSMLTGFLCN